MNEARSYFPDIFKINEIILRVY